MYKNGIGSIFLNLEAELAVSRRSELRSYGARGRWPEPREKLLDFVRGGFA